MNGEFDIRPYVAALKRRWLLLLAPAVLLTPLVVVVAMLLPSVYSSTARVLVESQQIPTNLARSTVSVDVAERIAFFQQRLTTRETLLDIANRFDVYGSNSGLSPSEIVERMRADTTIGAVGIQRRNAPLTGINITFRSSSPQVAQRVANEFLTRLLEQNIRERTERAFETSAYFRQEVQRLSVALADVEAELTAFKVGNERALPESLGFRRSELASLQDRIFQREIQRAELERQLGLLEEAQRSGTVASVGAPSVQEQELAALRRSLVQQRAIYAETHPTVRATIARIAAIEADLRSAGSSAAGGETPAPALPGTLAAQIEQLRGALDQISQRLTEDTRRAQVLSESIESTPNVEAQLTQLERRRDSLQSQYQQTVARLAEAEAGERLEVSQRGERFEVIEQPQLPSRPDSPNRPLIIAGGFGASVAIGFVFVVLAELLNQSLRSPADVERRLDIRPIVTVPYIRSRGEIVRMVWLPRILLLLLLGLVPVALYLVDQYYLPLRVLVERFAGSTGLGSLLSRF